jgi:hypothetical protein
MIFISLTLRGFEAIVRPASSSRIRKNLPFPSFLKRGLNPQEEIPPLKKGDKGGFKFASSS